jgi:hypothetical protein
LTSSFKLSKAGVRFDRAFRLLLDTVFNMTLVRKLVLACLDYSILLKTEHISGHLNCLADSLSRSNFQKLKTVSNSRRKALSNLTPALDSLNEEVNFLINMNRFRILCLFPLF